MPETQKSLNIPLSKFKLIGPARTAAFAKIGLKTARDILYYFPRKHLDRTNVVLSNKALNLTINGYDGELTAMGKVVEKETIYYARKEILKVQIRDSVGFFECIWFQGAKYLKNYFSTGDFYAISGKPSLTKYGHLQFAHPDFERIYDGESQNFMHTGKIIPIYSIPKELRTGKIGDLSLRRLISESIEKYSGYIEETLPEFILNEYGLKDIKFSIKNYHYPEDWNSLNESLKRFKFEEMFYLQLLLALRKQKLKNEIKGFEMRINTNLIRNFISSLPYKLTNSQLSALTDIRKDFESGKPMNRLIQGEVGGGKTIIALIAALIAFDNGYQAAVMAPTEILAAQHYKNISKLLENFGVSVELLTGGTTKKNKEIILKRTIDGEIKILIGTHALIENEVVFKKLGLAVIDEQHRFGVLQRSRLINKNQSPHVLIMTATPIPRTLTMTVYGDLDVSIINELPKNRRPIKTLLRGESATNDILKFIVDKCKNEKYQAFIVYPLISESDKTELKAAESYYNILKEGALRELNIGLIHGKMNSKEKEETMIRFSQRKLNVLISTTVIEVGVDVPDANIIIINDAHRFGLSQLHQLRGRVGRGSEQGFCILLTKDEFIQRNHNLSLDFNFMSQEAIERKKSMIRLRAMTEYLNGFDISEIDIKLRGPGDILGKRQSGFPEFKHINLATDVDIIIKAKTAAFELIKNDPKLNSKHNDIIKRTFVNFYNDKLFLAKIA